MTTFHVVMYTQEAQCMASREEQAADVLEAGTGTVSAYTV
jgi:hypothetical protein